MDHYTNHLKATSPEDESLRSLLSTIDQETEAFLGHNLGENHWQVQKWTEEKKLYITFFLAEIELALPVEFIQEIGRLPGVTPLPNLPPWVLGVSHIRGEITAVFDLKKMFNVSVFSVRKAPYFILLKNQQRKFVFPVDRISGIVAFEGSEKNTRFASEADANDSHNLSAYIQGTLDIEEKVLAVLDGEKLLHRTTIQA